ncbi:hypothetical protein Pmani_027874 [Petrolisthes manimaculis]|uniref:Reverse transcriptase RNase H-like domain-containing protein n=2 Tax=Petrolisthes manimaculis TaxID=1843537 RepID=A0AAE1P380_9EUCA|nr:hypothetical protein Pmani_027874 [Petrolisthes manimaculis]
MKTNFDKKSENRMFKVGDRVLLLLPTYKTPLQAKYEGPYEVIRECGSNRYIIKTPGRRKTERQVHANNMKLYRQRPVAMTVQGDKQREEDCFNPTVAVMKNSIILANPESTLQHLDPEKAEDIRCLLRKFQEVFQDVPQRCVVASHDVVLLKDSTPIKQAPYRVNPTKREVIRQEVKFLIDHGLAEPSSSEWASPCLLVPKPDGTYRMCTDYRRVNLVSRSDSYPLPTIQGILDDFGTSTYLTKLDLLKGYYQLKNLLITKPVLKCPDFNRRFEVQVDASDAGAGAVLLQEADGEEKILHPVCYMSHKFKPHQRSYSTVEKELLALILALEKWDVYLGQAKPILVYSDHSPLQFLMRMKNKNQRLTRWALFLQKYDLTVKHISGKQNVIADMLSRVN